MNKSQLLSVLQACLLSYEGMSEQEMVKLGLDPQLVKIGIRLNFNLQCKVLEKVK